MTYSSYTRPNTNFGYRQPPAPRQRRPHLFAIALAIFLSFVGLKIGLQVRAADHAAALAAQAHIQYEQQSFRTSAQKITNANSEISFSIAVTDINSGAKQTLGTAEPMQAASVGKLLTASLYLHEAELGHASLTDKINGYPAKTELQALINQSDDSAWQTLNDKLGHDNLLKYAQNLGLGSYDPYTDTISTKDVASFLQKLWTGDLLNSPDSKLLLSWMQHTNYEDFISPAVPHGYSIYHKVGLVSDNVNDAAIISNGQKTLVLVIFSDGHGTQNWDKRAQIMQQISAAALNSYFN